MTISIAHLLRNEAVTLAVNIPLMRGSEERLNRLSSILKRIKELWPEILDKKEPEPGSYDVNERRDLKLDEFDKGVLGEGLRSILKLPNASTQDYETCCAIADMCKVGKWFREVTAKTPLKEFEGKSDDEPELA